MSKAIFFALLLAAGCMGLAAPARADDAPTVEVWKTPTCGCCKAWVRHLEDAGFRVKVNELDDVASIRRQFKVPPALSSCHTAVVNGYVVEGHVPPGDIFRMLKQRPAIKGIYVPGMPVGSPGMEGPGAKAYDVLALDAESKVSVFATHQP